ncbi:hypothetical protein B4W72_08695 [Staphylococcus delphini]|uniref:Uncharacterized protein n=1 Tax=Staphylococcus delphini TaxID=53344 RepID=A0A2A4GX88_9STAP|nr:hypothetical protein B5C08_06745 [Staphylococcus delphini]PCF60298.1 hypothetical protein B5C01_10290 [Staphylococcus delphini]PCF72353.1 hypothetical protein B4W72_08695 [Staphylococcus delphini]
MYQSNGTLALLRCLDFQVVTRIFDVDAWEKKGFWRTRVWCLTIVSKCMIHKFKMILARRIILKVTVVSVMHHYVQKRINNKNTKRVD